MSAIKSLFLRSVRGFQSVALMATVLAGCSVSAADDGESSAAAIEGDVQSGDDLARSFLGDDGKMPSASSGNVTSTFPYGCPGCDVSGGKPLTNLIDARLVSAVKSYSCTNGKDHKFTPYFPGIQGYNDAKGIAAGLRTLLGGDEAVANLYVKYALRAVQVGTVSEIQGWSLLLNYNMPTANRPRPGVPVQLAPASGSADGRGVRVHSRANHSSMRLVESDETLYYRDGDQVEARLIGIWGSTANDADFINQKPEFLAAGALAGRDANDFDHFREAVVQSPEWRDFMYRASYEIAIAFKCGVPVFAHSGGGAVVTFLTRLLSVSVLHDVMKSWNKDFHVYGLEAVLSNEMNKRFHDSFGRMTTQQYVVGAQGSKTYTDVISKECVEIGQTPLTHIGVTGDINPSGWNGDGGGHGGIGFYTLANGRLTGQPKFVF